VLVVAMGLALGMLLQNAPAAIVICLLSTMVWSAIGRLGATGETLAEWLDLSATTAPLAAGVLTGDQAARLAVSVLCWVVLPLAAGVVRAIRADVA
jgi:hypothetical protein